MKPARLAIALLALSILVASCGNWTEGLAVDLRPNSTVGEPASELEPPVTRIQCRNTCQTFASIAALEAAYKRQMGLELDLSEEFTNYMGKTFWLSHNLYDGTLAPEAAETQMGAFGGGSGLGWLKRFASGFGVPEEGAMPFVCSYSLVPYCGDGCRWGTDAFNDFRALQFNYSSFNLNPGNLPLSALSAGEYYSVASYGEVNARDPNAIADVLDQGYEVVWDFQVRGYRGGDIENPIWHPRVFTESNTITRNSERDNFAENEDPLPKNPTFDVVSVTMGDTEYEEGEDWEHDDNKIRWIGDSQPEDGDEYTVEYQHEAPGGAHVMLIVGYNPDLRYFIVKNSWGNGGAADLDGDGTRDGWTLISYNYVRRYGIVAGYIREVNPPRDWAELPFVGRWNLSFDGEHGILDIYHMPGIHQPVLDEADVDLVDRRIGSFYDSAGNAYRVNGSVDGNLITLRIDPEDPGMPIDQLSGKEFQFYYFREDLDSMASLYVETDGSEKGGYALRCPASSWPECGMDWLESEFDSPQPFAPESWIGRWDVNYDGHEAELIVSRPVEEGDGDGGLVELPAEFIADPSFPRDVVLRVSASDPTYAELQLPHPDSPGSMITADVRHLTQEMGVAAGSYTNGDQSFGLYMVRSSSLLVANIISPVEEVLNRAQQHLFDVEVFHDPGVECCEYEWESSLEGFWSDEQSFTRWGNEITSGTHEVIVTVEDSEGHTASDSITIEVPENEPPTVEILSPADGTTFFESETISLTGRSVDVDNPPHYQLDEDEVYWFLGTAADPFATGHSTTLSGLSEGTYRIHFSGVEAEYVHIGSAWITDSITIHVEPDPVDLPPTAEIMSPDHNDEFTANQEDGDGWYYTVNFSGIGTDPEDGDLSGGSLVWTDSVNGGPAQTIGTGNSFSAKLYAPECFGNTHVITLVATDSSGQSSSPVSITVTVHLFC